MATDMKERPILMRPENAQKCFDGTKTQTRRTIKPQPMGEVEWYGYHHSGRAQDCGFYPMKGNPRDIDCWEQVDGSKLVCPYGLVGDRLWVREAFAFARVSTDYETGGEYSIYRWEKRIYGPYDAKHLSTNPRGAACAAALFYKGMSEDDLPAEFTMPDGSEIGWTPAIHMPRWACRTVLELTEVRVERLQECSETDAIKEGCAPCGHTSFHVDEHTCSYKTLWESINGAGSWALNPWVWVLTFRRVQS